MDVDEDDDFYAPEESVQESAEHQQKTEEARESNAQAEQEDEDLEEGEEEDEADSDDSVCETAEDRSLHNSYDW
jgi:pre-mRNA 3'-end-processing factor FIP1